MKNMEMLERDKIREISIGVLSPDYVQEHAKKGPIAQASYLEMIRNVSFAATNNGHIYSSGVRGVRKTDSNQFSAQKCDKKSATDDKLQQLSDRIDALEHQVEAHERVVGTLLIFLFMHEMIGEDEFGRAIARYQGKEKPDEKAQ